MLGITGYSGSGKTTLLEKLLPLLQAKGIKVAVIKHTHHNVELDNPRKDSGRMTQAGASQVIMACEQRWALMTETKQQPLDLTYLAQQFDPHLTDLILVEGFKQEPIAKILLHRQSQTMDKPLADLDPYVVALATDYPIESEKVRLDLNDIFAITEFICQWFTMIKNKSL
ncbi:molybdopterin-guanine dinucleotide biosynthesis protein B [Volucribacter amazonae]|nr:molybdopterin-guanine dinucleotide biosynthesis protein B [Volucribacter amazonae]